MLCYEIHTDFHPSFWQDINATLGCRSVAWFECFCWRVSLLSCSIEKMGFICSDYVGIILCVSLPVCVVALLPVISWPMDSIRAQVSHQGKLWKYARILQGPAGHNRLTEERESIKNQNLSCTACKVWLAYVLAFLFLQSCFSSNFADEASLATVRSVKVVWNLLMPCRDIFEVWK